MKALINSIIDHLNQASEYSETYDSYCNYLGDLGENYAYSNGHFKQVVRMVLFGDDNYRSILPEDHEVPTWYKDIEQDFCAEYCDIVPEGPEHTCLDFSIWADNYALFDVNVDEIEEELPSWDIVAGSPFKAGIIEYIERNTDWTIVSGGYAYKSFGRVKLMADRKDIVTELNNFIEYREINFPLVQIADMNQESAELFSLAVTDPF